MNEKRKLVSHNREKCIIIVVFIMLYKQIIKAWNIRKQFIATSL